MKIGDEVYIHGYIDEIRKDTVIIRNDGGYFGTVESEIKARPIGYCKDCRHFEHDRMVKLDGMSFFTPVDICSWWRRRNGCLTSEDGFCFMFEPRAGGEVNADEIDN